MLDKNIFAQKKHQIQKNRILEHFPELNVCKHDNMYSLSQYIFESPTKFYNKQIYNDVYNILDENLVTDDSFQFLEALTENITQFNHAIKTLHEINKKDIHEQILPEEDVELMYFISEKILYEYLKINDVVLLGLLKPIDFYYRKLNGKGTDNMDITNIINTLKKHQILNNITHLYDSVLRNSIAHGGISYNSTHIIFKDRHTSKDLYSWDFIKTFDNLLDCLNAIALAYKKIFFQYFDVLVKNNIQIPESILEIEIRYKANHFGWKILHSYENTIPSGKQYNLLIETNLNSRKFMNMSAVYTAIQLEELIPNKFNTLFLQIKAKYKMPCWQSVNLENLRKLISSGEKNIITDGTFFLDEKFWGETKDWLISNRNFIIETILLKNKNIELRYIKHHSQKRFNVIQNASVVLNNAENIDIENLELFIRTSTKDIISFVNKEKLKHTNTFSERFLPNKYYRINIYKGNMRKRSFHNLIRNENLIATFHINKTKQIKNIVPAWGTKEENKNCLIVWNRKTN